MSWRVIYIEESDYLCLYLDNVKIRRNNNELMFPLADIHTLIIDNYKLILSVQLINKCMGNNINIIMCGINHMPESIIIPYIGNHQMPFMLRKQIAWASEIKMIVQKEIVESKIEAQKRLLIHNRKKEFVINKLNVFIKEVTPGDKTNREGLAAKMYFRELFGANFKRFNEDIINAGLNYGYGIMRSQITKVLISKGLNTSLGIFHKGPRNNFNLSDDIIEPFRPIIDEWVYDNLMKEKIFKREHRIALVKLTTRSIYFGDKKQTLFNAISMYVDEIIKIMETGDFTDFKKPRIDYV